jgi:hypothetical protein
MVMDDKMGKRREGFLTQWQWDYINGKNKTKINKNRQRTEDFYIRKSFYVAYRQFIDFANWANEPELANIQTLKNLSRPGKKLGTSRILSTNCSICGAKLTFYLQKNGLIAIQTATGWLSGKTKVDLEKIKGIVEENKKGEKE